ncbi:hypothetical protein Leryth_005875 [Lithospermum erythrorhizon]|nr:hypothetical protein Leryth_005875 [Lithospermum erythrorhizon]
MLKKLRRKVKTIITKPLKKLSSKKPPPPPPQPPPPLTIMAPAQKSQQAKPFLFPQTQSTVLPDPSIFFTPELLSSPLPTNSFFQNFVLKNGDQAEYIHPYLIKSSLSSLTICYPSQFLSSAFIYNVFNADLTISVINNTNLNVKHVITAFDDLSATLVLPSSGLRFFLVRGSPFLTCDVMNKVLVYISTIHAILEFYSNDAKTKYTIKMNNGQTWFLYADKPINLTHDMSKITALSEFSGIIRLAVLPDSGSNTEAILDRFSSCYPVSGTATFTSPFCLEYNWDTRGWGDLLMLAHPLHQKMIYDSDSSLSMMEGFKYKSIDGDLVGVVGDSWILKTDPVSVTWHSIKGVEEESYPEIIDALVKDVAALDAKAISTTSSYFYGKLVARAASWMGTFSANGFLYDRKWGGLVTKQGSTDSGGDFGFGIYNDHHYHIGYFLYGIAVLAKVDPLWGRKYKPQAYSLMADFMNLSKLSDAKYTRVRCFDFWKLHSWAGGLTEFADGRNQESTSEAINAYYSAALMGLAYGDSHLASIASTLSALEIQSAQTWWHIREEGTLYAEDFTRENRVVGVLWSTKRDSGLWFAPADWRETRLGIQLLPLLPISEIVFSDIKFVKELVRWTLPALAREGVGEGWKGFVYALEGIYDKNGALDKIKNLQGHDDGNSLTNLLWWIHSRDDEAEGSEKAWKHCWFCHYSH